MVDIPVIPPSPPAPARAQAPDTFSQLADAFAAYIELMPGYYNGLADALEQLAAEIANQGFTASSTTSLTIGTGAKSLVVSTGAAFIAGQAVLISANGNPGNDITATIVAYNSVDGAMDVNVTSVNGSGTYNDWALALTLSVDLSGYLQKSGGIMSGPLTLPASTMAGATLNVPQGVAPSSPVNGDIWTTSTGIFARIAAVTRQLASISGTETFTNKTLTSPIVNGMTEASTVKDPGGSDQKVGFRGIPVLSATAARALVLNDIAQTVKNTTGGWSIPANSSVPFPIGSAITLYNDSASDQTITITTDTLRLAGDTATGTRTLAGRGLATMLKVNTTEWVISGAGLS